MYVFSSKNNSFYPRSLQENYEEANSWPTDGIEVSESKFAEYSGTPPQGKMRGSTADGMPAWLDIPPLTAEQLLSQAENKRQSLLKHADEITADWRTELVLGEINEFNKRQLSEWMAYKRELKAMEITMASEITWPIQPEI
ncbi:phage tail fiber assembly protein [Escherichia coli]|uniref:tail fiber assembly protein n=1 Tax=Enterobacteriaceae TaxID=543 RepID=UPI0007C78DE7|nr:MULTISPECIES: tail fiber assembly protein [Enterobacteriaceae]GCU32694.1 phage tail fiber assembly protein [Escherichia coli]